MGTCRIGLFYAFLHARSLNCPFLQSLKHLVSVVNFHKNGKYLVWGDVKDAWIYGVWKTEAVEVV